MNAKSISVFNPAWVPVVFFLLFNSGPRGFAQALYNYVRIDNPNFIRPSGLGSDSGEPSLNESGRVAFGGQDINLRFGIFSGDGTERNLIDYKALATKPGAAPFSIGSYVGSRVAFFGTVGGIEGVYNSDGVSVETILVDPTLNLHTGTRPRMNGSRQFAYRGGDFNSGKGGIYTAKNGSSNAVYTIPISTTRGVLQFRGVFETEPVPIVITDAGDLFFEGHFFCLASNPPKATDCQDSLDGILKGNGGPPTLLVKSGRIDAAGTHVSIHALAVSKSGLFAHVDSISDNVGSYSRLLKGTTPMTDTRSGPFSSFGEIAINDGGSVVFFAEYRDTAGKHHEGLFNGPDLARNKIIATDDPLFDSTVVGFAWSPIGFNNAGQVALFGNLATGKSAVVRADPVDGTTQVEWIGPGAGPTPLSGSATVASNWKPVNGDPPRVPTKNAAFSDTALFDRAEEYSVDLGHQHAERLVVKNGHVTFKSGDITVDALSFELPSMVADNAQITLSSPFDIPLFPTITCNHALIGALGAARADVLSSAQWAVNGSLRIGGPGEGNLTIDSNGEVTSGESRIGGSAGGNANVGQGGKWKTGNLAIGINGGVGELTIQNGGKVDSDRAIIGQELSPGNNVNNVTVQGGEAPNPSTWHPAFLTVGARDWGNLIVKDGGLVTVDVSLSVGLEPGGNGTVIVSGVNASALPSKLTAEQISVSERGDGELRITGGGVVETLSLTIGGSNGRGKVTVEGLPSIDFLPSKLKADELTIGSKSPASMSLFLRAEVQSRNAKILSPDDSSTASRVTIGGIEASWKIANQLSVGTEGVTTGGRAIINLVHGFLSATHVVVAPRGWILGSGTVSNSGETVNNGTIGALLLPSFNVAESPVVPSAGLLFKARAVNNRAISQGLSSATITIQGNYKQGPQGRLLIEIGGTSSEAHGHLIIAKEATLDGTLELRFINGFSPSKGDTFDFLQVGGGLSGTFAAVEMKNLASDFQFNISKNGTNISLIALNDGTFVTPLQGQISSSNVLTVGGISYLPYTLQVTNDCSIVEVTDALRRDGQELFQTLSERSDPACEERSANVSSILPLGALPPGNYQFHFILDGVSVHDLSFAVPADSGELLKVSRTAGGELKLEISGLPGVLYTIEASSDLKTWSNLPTHVGTFLGPYSALEPFSSGKARFYRVKIE